MRKVTHSHLWPGAFLQSVAGSPDARVGVSASVSLLILSSRWRIRVSLSALPGLSSSAWRKPQNSWPGDAMVGDLGKFKITISNCYNAMNTSLVRLAGSYHVP